MLRFCTMYRLSIHQGSTSHQCNRIVLDGFNAAKCKIKSFFTYKIGIWPVIWVFWPWICTIKFYYSENVFKRKSFILQLKCYRISAHYKGIWRVEKFTNPYQITFLIPVSRRRGVKKLDGPFSKLIMNIIHHLRYPFLDPLLNQLAFLFISTHFNLEGSVSNF